MGIEAPAGSERADENGAELHTHKVFAQNTGVCVEEPLREGEVALNLGSGKIRWPGWIAVDGHDSRAAIACDLKSLPYGDWSVDRVAAIHVFEHFYRWEVADVLLEWKRVLKPGGKIILELPCMDSVFGHIMARLRKGMAPVPGMAWLPLWGDPKYKRPEMVHKWGYFRVDMTKLLTDAGFSNIQHEQARYHFAIRDMRVTAIKPMEAA